MGEHLCTTSARPPQICTVLPRRAAAARLRASTRAALTMAVCFSFAATFDCAKRFCSAASFCWRLWVVK